MLWEHSRAANFAFYWNDSIATDRDDNAVAAHMHSHETYAHTLEICRTIAKRYPASPIAPRALYRAACAAYHLSNMNGWWRDEDEGHDHKKEASKLMSRIAKNYPESAFRHSAAKYATVFAGGRSPYTYRRHSRRSTRYRNQALPSESPMADFAPALSNKSAMSKSPFQ